MKRKEGASGGSVSECGGGWGSSGSEPSSHATWNTTDAGLRYANGPARDYGMSTGPCGAGGFPHKKNGYHLTS